MRAFTYASLGLAGLFGLAAAEDILMHENLKEVEYDQAIDLGYTVKLATDAEWRALTTADFASYKAIVIADPNCVYSTTPIGFLDETKATWSPAVTGNVVVIGTDPSFHTYLGQDGASTLIRNSIKFAADGDATGLYFALSCYYHYEEFATVSALSSFGNFVVRGQLNCYNNAHIVATHPAMDSLSDAALSDWDCSVHEAFSEYPVAGTGGFEALAIAKDILGVGSRSFGDETVGLPYIVSRGATPAACGNGKYEPLFNEECDHADKNGAEGDLCSISCKCLYGVLDAAAGTCRPKPPTSTGIIPSYSYTTEPPYPTTTTTPPTDCTVIVGIEIIIIVHVGCEEGSTVTTTTTSTVQRPIYNTPVPGVPCYPCALGSPEPGSFLTVSYTSVPAEPTPTITYHLCATCTAATTCIGDIPGYTPGDDSGSCAGCTGYVSEVPHTHSLSAPTLPLPTTPTTPGGGSYGTITKSFTTTGHFPVKPTTTAIVTAGAAKGSVGKGMAAVAAVGGLVALIA